MPAGTGSMVFEGETMHVSLRTCDTCKTTSAWHPDPRVVAPRAQRAS